MSRYQKSSELFQKANQVLVGGVNSPVRAFKSVGRHPLFIDKAHGAHLYDVDGHAYIDYVLTWGPAILGHAPAAVIQAVQKAAETGTSFGAPCEAEIELAELVRGHCPHIEKVRFVSSGTEATMSALRLARGITGRDKMIKFEGCYHGHGDSFLVKAGSGVLTLGLPDSPGVPASLAQLTLNAPYNDLNAVEALLKAHDDEVACIIVEPVAGNMGCVAPLPEFLHGLRTLCDRYGALLIFDEVMTGFRVARGGASERFGVEPDITCYGKVVGGGLPVGAFGGRQAVMSNLAPEGPVYQAGTLSGNPLAMAAGVETLKALGADGFYQHFEVIGEQLTTGLQRVADKYGIPFSTTRLGSMFGFCFRSEPPTCFSDVKEANIEQFKAFFWGMLEEGVYFAPSAFEAGFLSVAHSSSLVEDTCAAADRVMAQLV